jgi:hypothetical protein
LYLHWQDNSESLKITQAERGGGNFYLTNVGVTQEVEFNVINERSKPVIIQRIDFTPNAIFPAPILLDNEPWDGRPFRLEGKSISIIRYRAARHFFNYSSPEPQQTVLDSGILNPYSEIFSSLNPQEARKDRIDTKLKNAFYALGATALKEHESWQASELQSLLFDRGITFIGHNRDVAKKLKSYDMNVTFGGPCLNYLQHTLSVCTSMEISTANGNTFVSDYIGFGLRSPDLDRTYRELRP